MDEPHGELARYAFGYSDRKPGWLFWLIHAIMLAFLIYALFVSPVYACHRFSVWKYPYPQRCSVTERLAQAPLLPIPLPPIKDMPLPSIDYADPPDADGELGERLKALGLMREKLGTN